MFLDTDNMQGGICGIAKGANQIMTGTANVDFVLGSTYSNTILVTGNGSSASPIERMRITTSGLVGIGTNNPTGLTHWVGASDLNLYLRSDNSSGTIRWNYQDESGTTRGNHAWVSYGNGEHDFFTWTTHDGSSSAERMRLTRNGQLLIGRTSPGNTGNGHTLRGTDSCIFSRDSDSGETVQISRNTNDAVIVQFRAGDSGNATKIGHIDKSGSGVTYNSDSDYRKKENDVVISDGITKLKQLRPIRFNFKENPDKTFDGFFAH